MITSKQRAFLRGQAQPLNAIYQIGKTGFTEESVRGIEEALNARELIKLHVLIVFLIKMFAVLVYIH